MRELFRKNENFIYLNSGSHSITPIATIRKIKLELETYEENPTASMFEAWQRLWEVQKQIAPHFGASPKNFFFRSNVTQPLNEFIMGLQMPAGSEILTSNQEYGAVMNMCRLRSEQGGFPLKTFKLPNKSEIAAATADSILERVVSAFTPKTKMLVLSEILTGSGLVLPTERIATEARARGIFTIIDGAHSPGSMKLDLENSPYDFYAGNLHKWWMGPKGTGFGWFRRESFQHLRPIQGGWTTYDVKEPFISFAEGDMPAIKSLMLGCQDFTPFFALPETLRFWQLMTEKQIFRLKWELDQILVREVEAELGYFRFASTADQNLQGPLHSFLVPEAFAKIEFTKLIQDLYEKTKVQAIFTFIDGEMYLRLSPHIYNTEEEIVTAVSRLKEFFAG